MFFPSTESPTPLVSHALRLSIVKTEVLNVSFSSLNKSDCFVRSRRQKVNSKTNKKILTRVNLRLTMELTNEGKKQPA